MPRKPLSIRAAQAFEQLPATPDDDPLSLPDSVQAALVKVADPTVVPEDRAALYAILYDLQRRIRRGLGIGIRSAATPQVELLTYMERNDMRAMGPLSIRATPFDVTWPVNDPENWVDYGLQDELAQFAKIAPDYIVKVPEHYELASAALGEGVANNDPVAQQLHKHAKQAGWRREGGRRLSLAVKDVAS